jgi:hypothetical protein
MYCRAEQVQPGQVQVETGAPQVNTNGRVTAFSASGLHAGTMSLGSEMMPANRNRSQTIEYHSTHKAILLSRFEPTSDLSLKGLAPTGVPFAVNDLKFGTRRQIVQRDEFDWVKFQACGLRPDPCFLLATTHRRPRFARFTVSTHSTAPTNRRAGGPCALQRPRNTPSGEVSELATRACGLRGGGLGNPCPLRADPCCRFSKLQWNASETMCPGCFNRAPPLSADDTRGALHALCQPCMCAVLWTRIAMVQNMPGQPLPPIPALRYPSVGSRGPRLQHANVIWVESLGLRFASSRHADSCGSALTPRSQSSRYHGVGQGTSRNWYPAQGITWSYQNR